MTELVIAQEELFQGIKCDLWMDNKRNPYMTIQQLTEALEYKSRNGIEKILKRNPYLKGKEFSTTAKLSVVEGERVVKRETIVFTKDGIMEIGFLSPKPKAREFRTWARKVINAFVDGQLVWKGTRINGKEIRHELTDAIKEKGLSSHYYKHYTDLAYKSAVGFTAKQLREARGVKSKASPLDFLSLEELAAVNKRSVQIASLIQLGMDFSTIKATINNQGVIYQTTLKMPTSTN